MSSAVERFFRSQVWCEKSSAAGASQFRSLHLQRQPHLRFRKRLEFRTKSYLTLQLSIRWTSPYFEYTLQFEWGLVLSLSLATIILPTSLYFSFLFQPLLLTSSTNLYFWLLPPIFASYFFFQPLLLHYTPAELYPQSILTVPTNHTSLAGRQSLHRLTIWLAPWDEQQKRPGKYYNLLFLTLLNLFSGPSPESQQSKKGKESALSRNNSNVSISNTSNDSLDDSETLFIPRGKGQAKSQGATSANSATSKPRLGKRSVKDYNMDDTNTAPVPSKGGPPNKRAKTTELASSTKKPTTAPKSTTKVPKSTIIGSRSAPRPQSKGSIVESSGSCSEHLSTQNTSDNTVDDDESTTIPLESIGAKSKHLNPPKTPAPKARSKGTNKADGLILAGVDL